MTAIEQQHATALEMLSKRGVLFAGRTAELSAGFRVGQPFGWVVAVLVLGGAVEALEAIAAVVPGVDFNEAIDISRENRREATRAKVGG